MNRRRSQGMSLIELIITLMLVGVVAAMAAKLVAGVVEGQQGSRDRSTMAMVADTAVGRVQDELQGALPNSVRWSSAPSGGSYIEFVPITDAGHYRRAASQVLGLPGDVWSPDDPTDNAFDVLGVPLQAPSGAVDLVAGNLGSPDADVYLGTSRRTGVSVGVGGDHVQFTAAGAMASALSSPRFFLVTTPVSLGCEPNGASGFNLVRYSGYGWQATQPAGIGASAFASATRAVLIDGLARCSLGYSASLANVGMVNLSIGFGATGSGVQMDLLHQLAVDNTP